MWTIALNCLVGNSLGCNRDRPVRTPTFLIWSRPNVVPDPNALTAKAGYPTHSGALGRNPVGVFDVYWARLPRVGAPRRPLAGGRSPGWGWGRGRVGRRRCGENLTLGQTASFGQLVFIGRGADCSEAPSSGLSGGAALSTPVRPHEIACSCNLLGAKCHYETKR